jgi:hypothetical protein
VGAGVAQDGYGADNTAAEQFGITVDVENPEPGGGGTLSVRSPAATGCTLNWTIGSDDITAQENLEYLAYYSENSAMDTVPEIIANGMPCGSYTENITSATFTGLSANQTYYYNVIIKDEYGKQTAYDKVTDTSRNGLVAYYPFNGNAYDESVNSNHGTAYTVTLTDGVDNSANSAYYFQGTSLSKIQMADNTVFNAAEQTFTLWVKTNTGTGLTDGDSILDHEFGGTCGYRLRWDGPATAGLIAECGNGSTLVQAVDTSNNSDNLWHHVGVIIDATHISLYVDGEFSATTSHAGDYTIAIPGTIIILGYRGIFTLDEIRFYDRALSGSEITTLYDMEKPE